MEGAMGPGIESALVVVSEGGRGVAGDPPEQASSQTRDAMSGGFIVVGDNAPSEESGRSLAVSGSRAVIRGRTVGTGMGGDRAVFWTGEVAGVSLVASPALP
jgi:hypothetical protein